MRAEIMHRFEILIRVQYRIHALARRHSSSPRLAIVNLVRVHQTNVTDNLLAKLVTKRSTYLPISRFLFLHDK